MVFECIFASTIVFFVSFAKQFILVRVRNSFMSDAYFHMYLVDLIRSNKHRIPKYHMRFSLGFQKVLYPAFFHLVLSYVPKSFNDYIIRYFNAALDSVVSVVVFIISFYYGNGYISSLLLCFVYVFFRSSPSPGRQLAWRERGLGLSST